MASYYQLLNVPRKAPVAQIKRSFRALALIYHPDKTNNDRIKMEHFKRIRTAYEVLVDPQQRRTYDMSLKPLAPPVMHIS